MWTCKVLGPQVVGDTEIVLPQRTDGLHMKIPMTFHISAGTLEHGTEQQASGKETRTHHPSNCYLQTDDGPDACKVKEVRELREDYIWIGVQCTTTDMPTPCHLFKDDKQGGKWRVKMNCLN